jgi:hypothetical protein
MKMTVPALFPGVSMLLAVTLHRFNKETSLILEQGMGRPTQPTGGTTAARHVFLQHNEGFGS